MTERTHLWLIGFLPGGSSTGWPMSSQYPMCPCLTVTIVLSPFEIKSLESGSVSPIDIKGL